MVYRPYNNWTSNPVQHNPHSPAPATIKQQPVEIPGVLHQSRELFKPVPTELNKDNK